MNYNKLVFRLVHSDYLPATLQVSPMKRLIKMQSEMNIVSQQQQQGYPWNSTSIQFQAVKEEVKECYFVDVDGVWWR